MLIDKLTMGLEMSSSREGYKNVGAPALTPTTSGEPLNSTLSEQKAKPSMAVPKGTELSKERGRIPTKRDTKDGGGNSSPSYRRGSSCRY